MAEVKVGISRMHRIGEKIARLSRHSTFCTPRTSGLDLESSHPFSTMGELPCGWGGNALPGDEYNNKCT